MSVRLAYFKIENREPNQFSLVTFGYVSKLNQKISCLGLIYTKFCFSFNWTSSVIYFYTVMFLRGYGMVCGFGYVFLLLTLMFLKTILF